MLQSRNSALAIQQRVDRANERHKLALKTLRAEKLESAAVKTKAKLQREKALEKEKIRAATVAAMPKPEKDPIEEVKVQKLPEVRLHDQTRQNVTTFYEHPTGIVEPATDFDTFESGFESAKIDADQFQAEKRAERVKFNENAGKSTVRGTAALKKIRLEGAKNTLEEHLETLRRREVQLRGAEANGPLHSNAAAFASDNKFNKRSENQRQYQMETMIEQAFNTRRELLPDNELDISLEDTTIDSTDMGDDLEILEPTARKTTEVIEANILSTTEETKSTTTKPKEHTVRFNDEEQKLLSAFQEQKAEMERVLELAKVEHQRQMAEIEDAMKKVKENVTINSSLQSENRTLQSSSQNTTLTNGVTQKLDNVKNEMDRVKLYQQRLLEKYKADISNVESITLDQSSNIIVKEMDTEESITEDKSSKEGFITEFRNMAMSAIYIVTFDSLSCNVFRFI